jgi:hypothetical protein
MLKKFLPFKLLKVLSLSSALILMETINVYADVDGIPYNSDFPMAQYPYAQALDGCSGWSNPNQVPDTYGSVNFTEGCNQHDRCYYTLGSNWNTCNERLYSDLRAACERDLRVWVPPLKVRGRTIKEGFYLPPEPGSLIACYGIASKYYEGVQAGVALNIFKEAQDKQRRYEAWVAEIRSPPSQRCPENNITIRPNSSNLEFKRGTEWNPCPNYKFIFQNDGNLVLYSRNRAIWATGTNSKADLFVVQADGNVVLYGSGRAVWATNTGGNLGAFLAIQSDGNLVVYSRNGNALWSTGTGGR